MKECIKTLAESWMTSSAVSRDDEKIIGQTEGHGPALLDVINSVT
jgi:hypothetical protein